MVRKSLKGEFRAGAQWRCRLRATGHDRPSSISLTISRANKMQLKSVTFATAERGDKGL